MATTAQFANDANTVGLWHMDGTAGSAGKKSDSSSSANNLTENLSPTAGTGQIVPTSNGAYTLNGSTQFLTLGTGFNPGSADFTIEGWFFYTGSATPTNFPPFIAAWNDTGNQDEIFLGLINSGGLKTATYLSGDGSTFKNAISTATISTSAWTYYAFSKAGTTGSVYINGTQDSSTSGWPSSVHQSTDATTFGFSTNFGGSVLDFWNGSLDEWRISNVARSATDISNYYNGTGGTPPFLNLLGVGV